MLSTLTQGSLEGIPALEVWLLNPQAEPLIYATS